MGRNAFVAVPDLQRGGIALADSNTPTPGTSTTASSPPPDGTIASSSQGGGAVPAQAPKDQPATPTHSHPWRKRLVLLVILIGLAGAIYAMIPAVETALNTVSTDDAYINGHVTFLAPRVSGQVSRVLVDDNMRVKKGDLLVQIDKE